MEYKVETSLENFEAWSGGKDTLSILIEKGDCDTVEDFINECFCNGEIPTDTDINDFLWFERDFIAEHLGYSDWDAYEFGEENDEDEENHEDQNGTPIKVGDKVIWHDEAGIDDDEEYIEFTVVDDNGDGYFNLATDENDKCPERWAWHDELEVLE